MNTLPSIKTLIACAAVSAGLMALPSSANAQNPKMQAIGLIRDAMTAYGNLDLDTAQRKLNEALAIGPSLDPGTLARIHVSYGLLWVGGHGDNAKGQNSFVLARCLDSTVQIDPIYSTPDIEMVFTLAKGQATPETCRSLTGGVSATYTPAPGPVTPVPQPTPLPAPAALPPGVVPPPVPACGVHQSPAQQRKSTELPLSLQLDPNISPRIASLVVKYAFDGSTVYFDMPMAKAGNGWGTAMLTCEEGQISNFDPSSINYYIEGYDENGMLVCGHASYQGPFVVNMTEGATVAAGLPGTPEPQQCGECPPWNPKCNESQGDKMSGQACFSHDECPEGERCGDFGYCEGGEGGEADQGDDDGSNPVPKRVYFNMSIGSGGGFMNAPNEYYLAVTANPNDYDAQGVFAAFPDEYKGVSGAAWGGLPARALLGINIKPRFAMEVGFRFDLASLWTKLKQPIICQNGYSDAQGFCSTPDESSWGIWLEQLDTNEYLISTSETSHAANAWLVNLRARYRFVNDGKMQVSFFGGLGYGHLFYAPRSLDMDWDGTADFQVATPGGFNIELGPAFAYYFNRNVGFILEAPIDMVFGENSSFGINGELMIGLSFGG